MGYRVSAFGFLACEVPGVDLKGNYGFKDQWLAIQWVKDNIEVFGGRLRSCALYLEAQYLL